MSLGRWLTIDPGEMTGWAVFNYDRLVGGGQTELWPFADDTADAILEGEGPMATGDQPWVRSDPKLNTGPIELVVCEKFALYPDEARRGTLDWDEFRTVQLIGAVAHICRRAGVDLVKQPASIKKSAEDAGAKELFVRPLRENRHQNDAIRHGFYYIQTELRGAYLPVKDSAAERA